MITSFPTPYTDELLYSVLGRYHQREYNLNHKTTMAELFGATSACAIVDLPNRLEYLCQQFPKGVPLNPELFIDKHTLLPLYRPFLPQDRVAQITKWMKSSDRGGSIHMASGVMASGISAPQYLRLCPDCVAQDDTECGEAYWHRCHQVAGVFVCPIHEGWLWETAINSSLQKHVYQLVPHDLSCCTPLGSGAPGDPLVTIAKSVEWLLGSPHDLIPGLASLQKRYLYYLGRMGLTTYSGGRVIQREVTDRFISFYGDTLLRSLECEIDPEAEHSWLTELLRKPRKSSHPLRHILLIHFLGLHLEEFFAEGDHEALPFGEAPWPCLNRAADHLNQDVVHEMRITRNSENGKPVGNFFCDCGFAYARTGPDKAEDDRFRISRMISFGHVWERSLFDFLEAKKMSYRATARALGVDINTITRYKNLKSSGEGSGSNATSDEEEKRVSRRNSWLELQRAYPDAGRKELRGIDPTTFTWLYRYDREWLQSNVPTRKQIVPLPERIDWGLRDAELAKTARQTAEDILRLPGRAVQITVSAIGRRMGVGNLFAKKLSRLPKTASALRQVCETQDQYRIRRVRVAEETLLQQRLPVFEWRVVREARLRPGYSKEVDLEIKRIVELHGV